MSLPNLEETPDGRVVARGPLAPDVKSGDAVYWDEQAGQFKRIGLTSGIIIKGFANTDTGQVTLPNMKIPPTPPTKIIME